MRPLAIVLFLAACSGGAGNEANRIAIGDKPQAPQPAPAPRPAPAGPCVGPITDEGLARCDFGPRERMRGVWVTGFERSEFVPGGTGAMAPGDPGPRRAWLAFAPGVYPDPALRAELDALRTTGAVEIVFEGRRARPPGGVVVVDRIISARSLGPAEARR
jgi:hypothetical protein